MFSGMSDGKLIDLSHSVEHGMITYKGLPAPIICDYLSREASRLAHALEALRAVDLDATLARVALYDTRLRLGCAEVRFFHDLGYAIDPGLQG